MLDNTGLFSVLTLCKKYFLKTARTLYCYQNSGVVLFNRQVKDGNYREKGFLLIQKFNSCRGAFK